MWLGRSDDQIDGDFNGRNDPWSIYVVAQSGVDTYIVPAPVDNAVKHYSSGFSLHVAVRSANARFFAERKATYLPTVSRQNA